MVPIDRIERSTYRLQGGCSTPELNRRCEDSRTGAGAYFTRLSAGRGPLGGRGGSPSGPLFDADGSGVTSWTTLASSSPPEPAAGTLESGDGLEGSSVAPPATGTGNAMPCPFSRA